MKNLFVFLLIFIGNFSIAQTQLFSEYNFNSGEYIILGTEISEGMRNPFGDTLVDFYTNDTVVENLIKREWVFTEPSPLYACGYNYEISICKKGLEVESYYINLECNEINGKKGAFHFDIQKLRMLVGKVKKAFVNFKSFQNIEEARDYRKKILADSQLIMTATPDWVKYEGTFRFNYTYPKKNHFEETDTLLMQLTNEIKKAYPGENFELEYAGESREWLLVEVKCNKTLRDKFVLYPTEFESDRWKPYQYYLQSYWLIKGK